MAGLEVTSLGKQEDDWVFEIEITSNRPDWLSVTGVAREIAALTNSRFKGQGLRVKGQKQAKRGEKDKRLAIKIVDKEGCGQYRGTIIEGVKVGPSPSWMRKRLEAIGLRPINNIVDITNYCLYETGQPLHAFDLDKLTSPVEIIVRRAKDKETITTLDGIQREMDKDILVIADSKRAAAVAGIIGGADTEVDYDTKNILLEAAEFDALRVRKGTKVLGLGTDSSYRFERNVDPRGVDNATSRAIELIQACAGGRIEVSEYQSSKVAKAKERSITLYTDDVERILGLKISEVNIKQILSALGFKIKKNNKAGRGGLVVVPASFRKDVTCKEDLIEEIARIYGYDKIPSALPYVLPRIISAEKLSYLKEQNLNPAVVKRVRNTLTGSGFFEVVNYSLSPREAFSQEPDTSLLKIENPLSKEQEVLRTNLFIGLLNNISYNINHRNTQIKIFELGKIFKYDNNGHSEKFALGIAACGRMRSDWQRPDSGNVTFFDLKGCIEKLLMSLGLDNAKFSLRDSPLFAKGAAFDIRINETKIGVIGAVSPDTLEKYSIKEKQVFLAQLSADRLSAQFVPGKKFAPYSTYPSIRRDISLLLKARTSYEDIVKIVSSLGKEMVVDIKLIEQYRGKHVPQGFKNLLICVEYGSFNRTLKDEEVDTIHKKVLGELVEKLEVKIR